MGYSSSQVSLLALTWRKNSIGEQLEHYSLEKNSLARDRKISAQKYQASLNTKVYKLSNNGGANYVDLSYANLMRPGSANKNNPYLLTNNDGKIVLDGKYQKYAEMISPDGKPGDWKSVRNKVISELTGISPDKLEEASKANDNVYAVADVINALKDEGALLDLEEKKLMNSDTAHEFFNRAGQVSDGTKTYNAGNLYSQPTWMNLGADAAGAKSALSNMLNGIANNMKNHLSEKEAACLTEACNSYMSANDHYFGGTSEADKQGLESGIAGIKLEGGNYTVNMKTVLETVLGSYKESTTQAGLSSYGQNSIGTEVYYTHDDNSSWTDYQNRRNDWQTRYDAAVADHKSATDTENQIFTAEQESNIQFYDQLFSAIAERGWVADSQVSDNDYLNNMLQNNQYYITTVSSEVDEEGEKYLEFNTDIASNCNNFFAVNDSDAQSEALVQYEFEKSIINEKESRIDARMKNLETELSAVNNMIKGREGVRDKNGETFFGIFA